jgi:hypothetical protein
LASKTSIARRASAKQRKSELTLADLTITWKDGPDRTRAITGRQLAYLITAASERCPEDRAVGDAALAGAWIYRLRGLSALTFPDAGVSIYEDDARALVSDLAQTAAAEIAARDLDGPEAAKRFRVVTR